MTTRSALFIHCGFGNCGGIPFQSSISVHPDLLKRYRVVGIISTRQVAKTTLTRFLSDRMHSTAIYFDLERHPKIGASWEGFIIEQVIHRMGFRKEDCFFWAPTMPAQNSTFP